MCQAMQRSCDFGNGSQLRHLKCKKFVSNNFFFNYSPRNCRKFYIFTAKSWSFTSKSAIFDAKWSALRCRGATKLGLNTIPALAPLYRHYHHCSPNSTTEFPLVPLQSTLCATSPHQYHYTPSTSATSPSTSSATHACRLLTACQGRSPNKLIYLILSWAGDIIPGRQIYSSFSTCLAPPTC